MMPMKKITFNAPLNHKAYNYEPMQIEVEKAIPLYGKRFEQMRDHPLEDAPEIIENRDLMYREGNTAHCILFLDANGIDGILVEAEGADYARKSEFISNARAIIEQSELTHGERQLHNSGECIANKLQNNESYHLIFLDIELKQCSGIDVGNFIRNQLMDESTQIVFFSGKDGYDRQLFEFRPLGFIEKPLTLKKVTGIVEKYLRIYGASSELFTYKFNRDVFCVKLCEILYFKSMEHVSILYLVSTDFTTQPSGNAGEKLACGIMKASRNRCRW